MFAPGRSTTSRLLLAGRICEAETLTIDGLIGGIVSLGALLSTLLSTGEIDDVTCLSARENSFRRVGRQVRVRRTQRHRDPMRELPARPLVRTRSFMASSSLIASILYNVIRK